MVSTFQINESELDNNFVKPLETLFKNRNLTLTIEVDDIDTTEYLLSNSVNKERLLKSAENVKKCINSVNVKVDLQSLKASANA